MLYHTMFAFILILLKLILNLDTHELVPWIRCASLFILATPFNGLYTQVFSVAVLNVYGIMCSQD